MAKWQYCTVHEVTEIRDDSIFATKKVSEGWLSDEELAQAEEDGFTVCVEDYKFQKERPPN
jgi:hypothetical protein